MIVNVFLHGLEQGTAREVCTFDEVRKEAFSMGWQRVDKVIVMDFRPLTKINSDGKKEIICPDYEGVDKIK